MSSNTSEIMEVLNNQEDIKHEMHEIKQLLKSPAWKQSLLQGEDNSDFHCGCLTPMKQGLVQGLVRLLTCLTEKNAGQPRVGQERVHTFYIHEVISVLLLL